MTTILAIESFLNHRAIKTVGVTCLAVGTVCWVIMAVAGY